MYVLFITDHSFDRTQKKILQNKKKYIHIDTVV